MGLMWSSTIIIEMLSLGTGRAVESTPFAIPLSSYHILKPPCSNFTVYTAKLSGDTIFAVIS